MFMISASTGACSLAVPALGVCQSVYQTSVDAAGALD